MSERADAQLWVIKAVVNALGAAGISAWLFGGWGLDARIGRITREHGDIEFWLERTDAGRSKALLAEAGATVLATQPPVESCEFTWDGVDFSTAYFDRQPDGSFIQLLGRWSDWLFPPGSFGDEPGMLDGAPVLVMSVAGMLAMKGQYPAPAQRRAVAAEGHRRSRDTPAAGRRGRRAALTTWPPAWRNARRGRR